MPDSRVAPAEKPALTVRLLHTFVRRSDPVFPHSLPAVCLPKSPALSITMVIALTVLLGGCGGGGSQLRSSPPASSAPPGTQVTPPPSVSPAPPETPPPADPDPPAPEALRAEYERQGGLHFIHAAAMHRRGGTGDGITVGLIDSGSGAHPELVGKYVYEGNFGVDCKVAPPGQTCAPQMVDAADMNGHGTFIAGLIAAPRDGEGIVGVAYEARIASVALYTGRLTDGQLPSWRRGARQADRQDDRAGRARHQQQLGLVVEGYRSGTRRLVRRRRESVN